MHKIGQTGELSDDELTEYNNIDDSITTAMMSAERKLPKKGNRLWTIELGQLMHQVRYYHLLLRQAKGLAFHQGIMNKVKQKANITEDLADMQDIQRRLKNTWNSINNLRKKYKEAREKHLESLMENTDDKQKKQAIQQMKFREHTRW